MLPEKFECLEDAVSAFIQSTEDESEALFKQADVCALACVEENRRAWGMDDKSILRHIGSQAERAYNTMAGRLKVGQAFPRQWRDDPENVWAKRKQYSHYEICARQNTDDDPDAAVKWLSYCVEHDLSVTELKLQIKAAGGDVPEYEPQFLFRNAVCTVDAIDPHFMTVYFEKPQDYASAALKAGTRIVITALSEREQEPVAVYSVQGVADG
jgi:hypothetical protein